MSTDAVALSSACALPPFASPPGKHARPGADKLNHPPKMLDNSNVQLAPYQALPVAGPLITHHRAAALNVLEPGTMPEDVSLWLSYMGCRCVRGRACGTAPAAAICPRARHEQGRCRGPSTLFSLPRTHTRYTGAPGGHHGDHLQVHEEARRPHQAPHGVRCRSSFVLRARAAAPPPTARPPAAPRAGPLRSPQHTPSHTNTTTTTTNHRLLHNSYPYNLDFDYGALEGLTRFSINNLGDPFIESNYGVHSREFEVGVLNWFARLWQIEEDDYWGYITNCGTEGAFPFFVFLVLLCRARCCVAGERESACCGAAAEGDAHTGAARGVAVAGGDF